MAKLKSSVETFFLLGENSRLKCLVGNNILGFEHFLAKSTFDEEVSLQIGVQWITVINEPRTVIKSYMEASSRSPCMILYVLQRDHVSERDVEIFSHFQQMFGTKMEENTVVVLVGSDTKTSAKPNKVTNEHLEKVLCQNGRKVCDFNKNLKQGDLIKELITCWKSVPDLHKYKLESSSGSLEREIWKTQEVMTQEHISSTIPNNTNGGYCSSEREAYRPQEAIAQEHISGDNQAAVKKRNTLTIVLLGQTGSGKSATGNTILRKRHFQSHASSMPVTQVCQMAEETVCGVKIRAIDTPDFFDEDLKNQQEQIKKCKALLHPGPDVYLLVMELGRFTDGEREIVQNIQRAFGEEVVKETIVLFTSKEKLRGKTVAEYVKNTDTQLQELVGTCGSRCHAFNNNDNNISQVERLLKMILEMKKKTGNTDIEQFSSYKESEKKDCRIQ